MLRVKQLYNKNNIVQKPKVKGSFGNTRKISFQKNLFYRKTRKIKVLNFVVSKKTNLFKDYAFLSYSRSILKNVKHSFLKKNTLNFLNALSHSKKGLSSRFAFEVNFGLYFKDHYRPSDKNFFFKEDFLIYIKKQKKSYFLYNIITKNKPHLVKKQAYFFFNNIAYYESSLNFFELLYFFKDYFKFMHYYRKDNFSFKMYSLSENSSESLLLNNYQLNNFLLTR